MSSPSPSGRGRVGAAPRRLALAIALAAGVAAACRGGDGGATAGADVRRYQVRGEVVSVAARGPGPRQLTLRHEAIPDLVDASGRTVGMSAMVMPFEVAPDVPLDALRSGDKVEARLAVGWSPPLLRIEQLRSLPGDTPLDLGPTPRR